MLMVILPDEGRIGTLGRVYAPDNGGLAFDWTNSGVYFRFAGDGVKFKFDVPALNQHLYVQITVDGKKSRHCVYEGHADIDIALSEGEHIVSMVRVNEVLDGVPLRLGLIVLEGEDAVLYEVPALPDRRMLFIGDSITCGYGILTRGLGNGYKTAEQDGAHTFAALTATHFQAQAHFVCISGRGIARNCDNFDAPLIPEFFEQTTVSNPTPWDHTQYQPDVVVVNAGTNDTAGEIDPVDVNVFKEKVAAFVARLREVYPDAQILWVYGMMTDELHEALSDTFAAINDEKVTYLKVPAHWGFENEVGASSHPNLRSHFRNAGIVIDKVAELTGWSV